MTRTALGRKRIDGSCGGLWLAGFKSSLHLKEFFNPIFFDEEVEWSQYFMKDFAAVDFTKTCYCYLGTCSFLRTRIARHSPTYGPRQKVRS